MIAVTKELFWNRIGNFNSEFFIFHMIWVVISLGLILAVFLKPGKFTSTLFKAFMAATFLLNGIVFFEFYQHGPVSNFFYGPLFILSGLLFAADAVRGKMVFRLPQNGLLKLVTIMSLALVYTYPLFGLLLGRPFPYLCMPMNACPLTVLAIAMVAGAYPLIDKKLLASLLPWGLLGLPKALGMYDCYEDAILFLSGVYGLIMLIVQLNNKRITKIAPGTEYKEEVGRAANL